MHKLIVSGTETRLASLPDMTYSAIEVCPPMRMVTPRAIHSVMAAECASITTLSPCSLVIAMGEALTP